MSSDEDRAREIFEASRWPGHPVCPHCSATGQSTRLAPASTAGARSGVHQCNACRRQFTVTVGTIFGDSHVSLDKWLTAIRMLSDPATPATIRDLQRATGVTYKTAWTMTRRIRNAAAQSSFAIADLLTVPALPRKARQSTSPDDGVEAAVVHMRGKRKLSRMTD